MMVLFPLAEMFDQYNKRRAQLGLGQTALRQTDLKERLLEAFDGDLTVHGPERGRKTLIFQDGLNSIVTDALKKRKIDKDMQVISEAAKIVREDIFAFQAPKFDGNFTSSCQVKSIPSSLLTLMSMILFGPLLICLCSSFLFLKPRKH